MAKNYSKSETKVIKRSEINLTPYNIKNHSDEQIKLQAKNIRTKGYFGGVLINSVTGNIIDGNRRVQSLDILNKYDGTPKTDYEIKVEVTELDAKAEKEQLAFMALANSKADYNLVAHIIDDIDYKEVGISEAEYEQILDLKEYEADYEESTIGMMATMEDAFAPKPKATEQPKDEVPQAETPQTEIPQTDAMQASGMSEGDGREQTYQAPQQMPQQAPQREAVTELPRREMTSDEIVKMHEEMPHMTKEEVKGAKKHCEVHASNQLDDAEKYVVISFANMEEKEHFCEMFGFNNTANLVIEASKFLSMFE